MRRRSLGIITVLAASIFTWSNAFGYMLWYAPQSNSVTVAAGSGQSMPMTLTLDDGESLGVALLAFAGDVEGDLPLGWISASPQTAYVSKEWPTTSTTLYVTVPEGTPLGTYGGYIFARIKASHRPIDVGEGMYVEVHVPAKCTGKPEFEITSFGPEAVWPPQNTAMVVTVSGYLAVPEGCTLAGAGYSVDDEYGVYSCIEPLVVGTDGSFNATIPLDASRDGGDKDGREYNISLYAEDEMGIGTSQTMKVVIPHDGRGKVKY